MAMSHNLHACVKTDDEKFGMLIRMTRMKRMTGVKIE